MNNWKEYLISELIDEIAMGPFGSNIKVDCFVDAGIPVLNGSNVNGYKLNDSSFRYVTKEKADSLKKANAYRGDIIITHRGTLGQIVYIPTNSMHARYVISQSQFRIRCNEKALPEYIVYYFHTRVGQHKLLSNRSQVGVPALARPSTTFKTLTIDIPPLADQKVIADTLSCLDDKIELNNKMNKNLEAQAQAIFKSWFVDFEPFQDGEFVDSELGRIPKGWRVGTLGEVVKSVDNRGKTPPLSEIKTNYPIIDVKALSGQTRTIDYNNCTKYVDKNTYETWFRNGHPKYLDILISTVGSLAEMKLFLGDVGCIAQNVVGLRCSQISPLYIYQYMQFIKQDLIAYNIGSVQPSIKVTHIIKQKIIIPQKIILNDFNDLLQDITEKIFNNKQQTQALTNLRNTLLPKLMSGEVRVPIKEVG